MGFKFVQPWDLGSSIEGASGFSISAFMSAQADGYWFDFTKTDRFFQEATGPTLADDVGEALGLALDSRSWSGNTLAQQLAAQTERIVNGDLSSGDLTGFTVQTVGAGTTEYLSGAIHLVGTNTSNRGVIRQTISGLVVGQSYQLSWSRTVASGNGTIGIDSSSTGTAASVLAVLATGATSGIFVATATTLYFISLPASGGGDYTIDNISVKPLVGKHGVQATGTLKPLRQTAGFKGDGTDDNHLTPYLAGNGANFLYAKTTVPATLAAVQVIHGASGASANRVFVGINTSGQACAGVGSDSTTTIVGTTDLRGTEADIALTFDGSTVRLIVNGVVEYEAAQNSTPTIAIPLRLWALNDNGTGGSYYAGYCKHLLAGREFLTVSRFNQIKAALSA